MSINLVINGQTFAYPETGDENWGVATTGWASAVTSGMLQKAGGLFQLLAEVDFGPSFGVKSLYYKTRTANVADAGQFRLARADVISWRNQAADGNLNLAVNSSNELTFNGVNLQNFVSVLDTATIDLTLAAGVLSSDIKTDCITDAMINSAAAIAFSKLAALTSGNILVGSAGNVATSVAMSGDATIIASGALTVANDAITNAKLADMAATTIKGNATGGAANPTDLTGIQTTALLVNFVGDSGSGGTKGLVPAPTTGDATKFLKGNGTWTTAPGTVYTFSDTNSIDLTDTANTITADLNLSSDPADAANKAVELIIETDGLRAQVADLSIQLAGSRGNIRASEAGGTTTLTVADDPYQIFDLSAGRTLILPTTSVLAGATYKIVNDSSFNLTVQASDASVITILAYGSAEFVALITTPIDNGDWKMSFYNASGVVSNPTATQVSGLSAAAFGDTIVTRTKLGVTISGQCSFTKSGGDFSFRMALPTWALSDFTGTQDCGGTFLADYGGLDGGYISSDATNNQPLFSGTGSAGAATARFILSYIIK